VSGFFGLPSNYSILLHKQIFELCYYGNGFTQEGVYRLPVHLRNFYYKQLVDAKEVEKKAAESGKQSSSSTRGPNVRVRK
jgi:hypothetical protein